MFFQAIDRERYLVGYLAYEGHRDAGKLNRHIVITDDRFKPLVRLDMQRDWTFSKNRDGGWVYQPFAPRLEVCVGNGAVYLAHTDRTWILREMKPTD